VKKSSFYLNLLQVFFGIGAVLGPLLSGFIVSSGIRWQLFYYVMGSLTLILAVVLLVSKFPELVKSESISFGVFKTLIPDKKFLLICLCMLLYTGSEVGSWGFMSVFLKDNMGFDLIKSSIAVAVFWSALTIGRLVCGSLTLRFKLRSIILILASASSILCVLSGLVSNEIATWVILICLGLSFSSQWPLISAYGIKQYTTSSTTVFSLLIGSGGLGTAIIPYLLGIVAERANTRIAVASPSIFFLIIVVIFLYIDKIPPKHLKSAELL
jgi:fucose permease